MSNEAKYTAGVRHHSIARSQVLEITARNIAEAKRRAWRELGAGYVGHVIVIYNAQGECVASRTIGARRWDR